MMNKLIITPKEYNSLLKNCYNLDKCDSLIIYDHLNQIDVNYKNIFFDFLEDKNYKNPIFTEYFFEEKVKSKYPTLNFRTSSSFQYNINFRQFENYKPHPKVNIKNFICSFNGTSHVSRQLLTACLYKFGLFNKDYVSKNFIYGIDDIDGVVTNYCKSENIFYRKFLVPTISTDFYNTIYSFGHNRFDHKNNIRNLDNKITSSFIHLVSETVATSYYPFVTEKLLYSVTTRGLFLAYAQPNWHSYVEKYFGFKKYSKLFDYSFDTISNPIIRLVELISMILKFEKLTYDELYDLYLTELDTINFNYDHFYSGDCLKQLGTFYD